VGPAANTSSGETRLGLSATAAAAVLYGAVVLFGLGPTSPLALDREGDLPAPVVQVPHDAAAPGPELRRPQASPGPARPRQSSRPGRDKNAVQPAVSAKPTVAPETPDQPTAPRPPATASQPHSAPAKKDTVGTSPTPTVTVPGPELPITTPSVELPDPGSLLPPVPPLPQTPPLPLLQLPG
jgi:hypothetical protein